MEVVERLNGQNVEPCATIDEGPGDLHVAADWGTKHREGASGSCALELICRAERDGALGPSEQARGLELGEDCIHFTSKLLEDMLRGWGLCSAQDAGDSTRFLEGPSPLVLMGFVILSWRWRQRRESGISLRTILTRLIPPGTLAKLILRTVLTRPVVPLLAWATVVPASAAMSSSSAVAPVAAVGASTEASFANGSKLLTVTGVVGV